MQRGLQKQFKTEQWWFVDILFHHITRWRHQQEIEMKKEDQGLTNTLHIHTLYLSQFIIPSFLLLSFVSLRPPIPNTLPIQQRFP